MCIAWYDQQSPKKMSLTEIKRKEALCNSKEQETKRGSQEAYKRKEQHGLSLLTEAAANYYYPYPLPLFPLKKQENGEGNRHLEECTERSQILK